MLQFYSHLQVVDNCPTKLRNLYCVCCLHPKYANETKHFAQYQIMRWLKNQSLKINHHCFPCHRKHFDPEFYFLSLFLRRLSQLFNPGLLDIADNPTGSLFYFFASASRYPRSTKYVCGAKLYFLVICPSIYLNISIWCNLRT